MLLPVGVMARYLNIFVWYKDQLCRWHPSPHNIHLFQMPRDWEEVRITVIRPGPIPTSSPCGNTIPDDDKLVVALPAGARFVALAHMHTLNHKILRWWKNIQNYLCVKYLWCRVLRLPQSLADVCFSPPHIHIRIGRIYSFVYCSPTVAAYCAHCYWLV